MATGGITLYGATVSFDGNSYGELLSISGSRTRNVTSIYSCDSTDQAVEKIAGALDEGSVAIRCIYDGGDGKVYNDMNTDHQAGDSATLLITMSDTSTFSATAIITSLSVPEAGDPDGACEVSMEFAISGKYTFTDVAA